MLLSQCRSATFAGQLQKAKDNGDNYATIFAVPRRGGARCCLAFLAFQLRTPRSNRRRRPNAPSPGASDPAPNLSDQKLDAAAAAALRVATLKQDYQQRIAAAPPSEKERIAEEAIGALSKAVTDQGLTVNEYTSILEVAQANPEVREKIRQRIRPSDK